MPRVRHICNQLTSKMMFLLIVFVFVIITYRLFSRNIQRAENLKITTSEEDIHLLKSTKQTFSPRSARKFPMDKVKFRSRYIQPNPIHKFTPNHPCKYWAVVWTLFEPSEAVRRFLYLNKWCVVIVGDEKGPDTYKIPTTFPRNFIFLDREDQLEIKSPFVQSLPWNCLARKNIGYLYAIAHGARVIWDFGDRSMLKFWIDGASVDKNLWIESFVPDNPKLKAVKATKLRINDTNLFFNPLSYLGSPFSNIWPRGFPPNKFQPHLQNNILFFNETLSFENIAVLQSLADHEPDVDSNFRQTKNTPFYFDQRRASVFSPLFLPHGVYSPMNANAALHFKRAFFALYLPVTVDGRLSDIWRSYIGQTLFSFCDLIVGFLPRPLVEQDQIPQSVQTIFTGKTTQDNQTKALVEFLEVWRKNKIRTKEHFRRSIEDLMEELYIQIYEAGFIGEADVFSLQLWLEAIVALKYKLKHVGQRYNNPISHSHADFRVGHSALYQPNGFPNRCLHPNVTKQQATFWTSDLHVGTRIDTPTLLASLGQTIYITGKHHVVSQVRKTPHFPDIFKRPHIKIYEHISEELRAIRVNKPVNDSMIKNNLAFFQKDPVFKTVNAFFCSFPASMCELWMPFNKTKSIIFLPAHRYNLGRCDVDSWTNLNAKLKYLDKQNKLSSKSAHHVIAAASRYDLEYLKYYTGLNNVELLTSFSGFYTQDYKYNVTRPEILVMSRNPPEFLQHIDSFKAVNIRQIYKFYTFENLTSHRAIIFFPYAVMSFKFTEFYSLNIPLFVPSAKYFRLGNGLGKDRTSTSAPYCVDDPDLWWKMKKAPSSVPAFNPSAEFRNNPEGEMYWGQFSDFYDWPHVQYFDNRTDLERKFALADLVSIHRNMKKENEVRKFVLLEKWCNIIHKIHHDM